MNTPSNPKWIIRLRELYDQLSDQEKNIADFIRRNVADILGMSISEIAKETGTSKSTVVRFCNHLGYSGLKEFKIDFYGKTTLPEIENTEVKWGDSIGEVKNKVFTGAINALKDSFDTLSEKALKQAAEALRKAKNIDIYGQGGSSPIAIYLRHQLMKIGIRSSFYPDAHSQHLSLSQFEKGDVAIAISCSGENPEIVAAMQWVKTLGIIVIAITNFPDSSLGKLADHILCNTAGSFFDGDENSYARIAQLVTVDTLYLVLAMLMGKKNVEDVRNRSKIYRDFTK